jgi:hypothetical protein
VPFCSEISKFFKKNLVKNVQFRYVTTGTFFSPLLPHPPSPTFPGKIFLVPFSIP